MWVSPFRDLRINGYLLLPEAFRSLSRLSSALSAKASALCSSSLNLNVRFSPVFYSDLRPFAFTYIALYVTVGSLKVCCS